MSKENLKENDSLRPCDGAKISDLVVYNYWTFPTISQTLH